MADIVSHRVVVKASTTELDPMEICEAVQKKTGKKTELISPLPKPPKEEGKKEEKKEEKIEEKKEEPTPTTVILKVGMHCQACAQVLQKRIKKVPGVELVDIDLSKGQVMVKGFIDPNNLVGEVYRKTRKHASIVKEEKKEEKKKEEEKKEEGGGGGDKKEAKPKGDDNNNDDMKKKSDQWPKNYYTDYVYAPQVFSDENPNACIIM